MTLLDNARRISWHGFMPWEYSCNSTCTVCGASATEWGDGDPFPHTSGCPWLSLPKIVAALEAATVMARRMARQRYCNGCGREGGDLHLAASHDAGCERWALINIAPGDPWL